ncbi:plasmid mobilization relaxosome protein MobC [Cyanobacteria bacterium FACHB-DQ100]|nr:plasmid mobilization relaxosome protein MobC [Cyanobacteria bacterium FACHB-DQ100]
MPRQRKSPTGELRTLAVPVYMSSTERQNLGERAGSLSLSEYLLMAGLGQHVPQRRQPLPVPELNRLTYLELEKIGRNLNQISKACHVAIRDGRGCNVNSDEIEAIIAMIRQLRLEVIAATIDVETEDDEL